MLIKEWFAPFKTYTHRSTVHFMEYIIYHISLIVQRHCIGEGIKVLLGHFLAAVVRFDRFYRAREQATSFLVRVKDRRSHEHIVWRRIPHQGLELCKLAF